MTMAIFYLKLMGAVINFTEFQDSEEHNQVSREKVAQFSDLV